LRRKAIFALFLAALVYHCDYLKATVANDHPIRSSPFFTILPAALLARLRKAVICGEPNDEIEMKATGGPAAARLDAPQVKRVEQVLSSKVDSVKEELSSQLQLVQSGIIDDLRARSVQANTATYTDLEELQRTLVNTLETKIDEISLKFGNFHNANTAPATEIANVAPGPKPVQNHRWRDSDGKMQDHRLTATYRIPKGLPRFVFGVWMLEHEQDGQLFPPLRECEVKDLGLDDRDPATNKPGSGPNTNKRREFAKMRRLMGQYEETLRALGWSGRVPANAQQAQDLFDLVAESTEPAQQQPKNRRKNTLAWTTLQKNRGIKRVAVEAPDETHEPHRKQQRTQSEDADSDVVGPTETAESAVPWWQMPVPATQPLTTPVLLASTQV
jgi:hypothetical protein